MRKECDERWIWYQGGESDASDEESEKEEGAAAGAVSEDDMEEVS